jgi:hypothetical protein
MEGVEGDMFEESDENYKKKKTPVVWQTFWTGKSITAKVTCSMQQKPNNRRETVYVTHRCVRWVDSWTIWSDKLAGMWKEQDGIFWGNIPAFGCRRLYGQESHSLYASSNVVRVIKKGRIRSAGHVALIAEMRNTNEIFVVKSEGKRPHGRPRYTRVYPKVSGLSR